MFRIESQIVLRACVSALQSEVFETISPKYMWRRRIWGPLLPRTNYLIFRIRKYTWGYQKHQTTEQEHERPLDDLDGFRSGEGL